MKALEHCTLARAVFRWAVKGHLMTWREYDFHMRAVIALERAAVACQGKSGFPSFGLANAVARRRARGSASRHFCKPEKECNVYRCRACGLYHVGGRNPEMRRHRRRQRARLIEEADA